MYIDAMGQHVGKFSGSELSELSLEHFADERNVSQESKVFRNGVWYLFLSLNFFWLLHYLIVCQWFLLQHLNIKHELFVVCFAKFRLVKPQASITFSNVREQKVGAAWKCSREFSFVFAVVPTKVGTSKNDRHSVRTLLQAVNEVKLPHESIFTNDTVEEFQDIIFKKRI